MHACSASLPCFLCALRTCETSAISALPALKRARSCMRRPIRVDDAFRFLEVMCLFVFVAGELRSEFQELEFF